MKLLPSKFMGVLTLGVLMGSCALSHGSDNLHDRATLVGLEGVEIVVDPLSAELCRAGLDEEQILSHVESMLRRAAIPVFDPPPRKNNRSRARFVINLSAAPAFNSAGEPTDVLLVRLGVELKQAVVVYAQGRLVLGTTWSSGAAQLVQKNHVAKVSEGLESLVDDFIGAYFAANNHRKSPSDDAHGYAKPPKDIQLDRKTGQISQ